MADIVLDGVTKQYPDGAVAVQDVNVDIADGEFVILVGPSGCGKSTTLNMIAGLEDITSGELRIGGEVVNDRSPRDRDIAMVFQNYALYPHMTVRKNMGFALELSKTDQNVIDAKVQEAADILDLSQHLDRKPANLSGGQRQRVAMGRAIVRDPKAFLMDEPLSNLDAKLRVQMRTEVSRLQKRLGTTTVYVTHDQTEAMTLGDRVVVMRGGDVQQIGTPEQLYEFPQNLFVAGFIGSPAMNFIPATLEEGELRSALGRTPLPEATRRRLTERDAARQVILGIRPEHFEDVALVDPSRLTKAATFTGTVDVRESMGSDVYVYFELEGERAQAADLEEAAEEGADVPAHSGQLVARLDAASTAREGASLEVCFDPVRAHVFDPRTGEDLSLDQAQDQDQDQA